jgi:carbonic anhydrase/acetyltransferase-like protein (isoleucine patch superfamily)
MQQLLKLKKALKVSQLSQFAEFVQSGKLAGNKTRNLTSEEIAILERKGNLCEDWSQVLVEPNFDPARVHASIFQGRMLLPAFYGTVLTPSGVSVPTGIYRSTLQDCAIENAHIQDVSLLSNVWVQQGAILQNVGSFVTSGLTHYGAGDKIAVGNEMGGRSIYAFPEITPDLIEAQLFSRKDKALLEAIAQHMEAWSLEVQQRLSFVGKGAMVCNTNIVRNSWIGPYARVDGAAKLRNAVLLSSLEEPAQVYDGVILENSSVQEGVKVHSFAQVKHSVLMRRSRLGSKAIVNFSVIGPCCHVDEAEVTSSYIGPLTQLHHHALLIAALWPEGRGNVGYGANVGSNHTGRMPDQEIMPGIGMFFGLGCNVKFPANFSESPFTIVATGVTCDPQRLMFPFSLIRTGEQPISGLPLGLNELVPGWVYTKNAFALQRNLYKFGMRSKGYPENLAVSLQSAEMARLVLDAWRRLQVTRVRDFYTEAQILGLGSNYLRESTRQDALASYRFYLERFCFDAALSLLETSPDLLPVVSKDVRKLFQGDLLKDIARLFPMPDSLPNMIKRHRTLEKRWLDKVTRGQERDIVRGSRIFDDYEAVHPVDQDFQNWSLQRFEDTRRRCNLILRTMRIMFKNPGK